MKKSKNIIKDAVLGKNTGSMPEDINLEAPSFLLLSNNHYWKARTLL